MAAVLVPYGSRRLWSRLAISSLGFSVFLGGGALYADPDTSPWVIKAAPTPAAVEAKPVIATRGTPAVSHNDADTSAAAAQAAATELCVQALKGLGKLKSDKQQEAVAACKEAALSPSGPAPMAITYNSSLDNCVDGTKTLCASPDVWRIARRGFTVTTSSPLTIKTNSLVGFGGSTPDTVLYVLKCADSSCTSGDIRAIDDDGNDETSRTLGPYDSKVVIDAPDSGTWAAVVVSYSMGRHGTATIDIAQSGGVNQTWTDETFGGWHVRDKELRTNDVLLVAKNPGTASMTTAGFANYHDSLLFAASTMATGGRPCTTNCSKFQFQDDTYYGASVATLQTRMTIDAAMGSPTAARVVVGVYGNGTVSTEYFRMNARLAHVRRPTSQGGSWTGTAQADLDSDGLTSEIEDQLGTCDASLSEVDPDGGTDVIVIGYGCNAARDWVNDQVDGFDNSSPSCSSSPGQPKCWSPKDSDNDGIDDASEVFAVAATCDAGPAGPYRHATNCTTINPVYASCDTGDWCVVEPDMYSGLNTPYFGQCSGPAQSRQTPSDRNAIARAEQSRLN